jgi:hypothetical protein
VLTAVDQPDIDLIHFVIEPYPENIYWYDPYYVEDNELATEENLATLSIDERTMYHQFMDTLEFNAQYKNFTGRSYLVNYLRSPPRHFMWPAEYFDQRHWIVSPETHFISLPLPNSLLLSEVADFGSARVLDPTQPRVLAQYRNASDNNTLNMTLTVLSCVPRVFEISNFLSEIEIQHVLQVASELNLSLSTTATGKSDDVMDGRTSYNSWIHRDRTPVFDAIYRRAADLLRIDEALLRERDDDEYTDIPTRLSMAEELQLVHYGPGQLYNAVRLSFRCTNFRSFSSASPNFLLISSTTKKAS